MAARSRPPTTRARSYRATATLTRVRAEAGKSSGFWLRGSGACALRSCIAADCGSFGVYVDAAAPCVFQDCEALRCYDAGVMFDLPYTELLEHGKAAALTAAAALLASTPHSAKVCVTRS
jgi:hypothetical protein